MSAKQEPEPEPPETGFTVFEQLSIRGWLNTPTEGFGEYIHLFDDPENRRLWLFRAFKESGAPERIVTSVPNAQVGFGHRNNPVTRSPASGDPIVARDNRQDHGRYDHDPVDPRCWYLTGSEADTLIAWLDLLAREQGEPQVRVDWYGDNGKENTAGSELSEESIYFRYTTDGGKERRVVLQKVYASRLQMMANFD